MNKSDLIKIFQKLGASHPEAWAESQIEEGIPQLVRFLFLKGAWQSVVKEDDTSWIETEINDAKKYPNRPYAGLGQSLLRMIEIGANKDDINELVRNIQAQAIINFCYLLEDYLVVDGNKDYARWMLFCVDEYGEPTMPLTGLHESVLETDPTGREMRPKVCE